MSQPNVDTLKKPFVPKAKSIFAEDIRHDDATVPRRQSTG